MMVLSNAERQRRYRERRASIARGELLADQIRALMLEVLRIAGEADGYLLDVNGEPSAIAPYLAMISDPKFIKANGHPRDTLAEIVDGLLQEDLSDDDRTTVERARDVIRAAGLQT